MGLFDKKEDTTAQQLKDAQNEVERLKRELAVARSEIEILKKSKNSGLNDYSNIITHFQTEISKLSKFAVNPVIYRYRVMICAINDLLIPLAQNGGNADAVETLTMMRDKLPTDFAEIMIKRITLSPDFSPDNMDNVLKSNYFSSVPGADEIPQKDINNAIKLKQSKILADKLYEYFGKKYFKALENRDNPDLKTWLECVLNMGTIAADWAESMHDGRDMIYCYNYNRIMKDFNKDNSQEYKLHDYTKSTSRSDAVYDFIQGMIETFGIDRSKLAFLVDNYRINGEFVPDTLQQNIVVTKTTNER